MKYNDLELRSLIIERFDKPHHRCADAQKWPQAKTWDVRSTSCADHLKITTMVVNNKIEKACFSGHACAIAIASTDLFIDKIIGKDLSQINQIMKDYRHLINEGANDKKFNETKLDNLIAFKNVYRQKNRKACALMVVNGLDQLLAEYDK